jgi:hypothetical protein
VGAQTTGNPSPSSLRPGILIPGGEGPRHQQGGERACPARIQLLCVSPARCPGNRPLPRNQSCSHLA